MYGAGIQLPKGIKSPETPNLIMGFFCYIEILCSQLIVIMHSKNKKMLHLVV